MDNGHQTNHRWNIRQAIKLSVDIYRHGAKLLVTQTGDISMTGMFIDTPPHQFEINQRLFVSFPQPPGETVFPQRLATRVVRSTSRGSALAFHECDADTLHALHEMLYETSIA
jgi:PilZ domain